MCPEAIYTIFSAEGRRNELHFAIDLAQRLEVPLALLLQRPSDAEHEVFRNAMRREAESGRKRSRNREDGLLSLDLDAEIEKRIRESVSASAKNIPTARYETIPADPARFAYPPGVLVVSNEIAKQRGDLWMIAPFDEHAVAERGEGEIMIPLGNGESGQYAVTESLAFVKRLGFGIVFWHTTWKNPSVDSTDPQHHVCTMAGEVLRDAEFQADRLGVRHRSIIETAPDVVEGLLRRALLEQCVMIIMARGQHTGRGRYVDRLLARPSPIPVLVVGKSTEVSA